MIELFCLERDIPLYGYRSITLRRERAERGIEPDECYCRDRDAEVPDVALEVIVTNPMLDKLEVYRGLGVREVFPEIDLAAIARYAAMPDQHAALRAVRDELRGSQLR